MDLMNFKNAHILVVGDVMLDRYCFGNVDRISPEAPVPVLHIRKRSDVLGGAGNVVSNLIGLGCKITVIGVCGNDDGGRLLNKLLDDNNITPHIFSSDDRPTIIKTRVISNGQQLIRLDEEEVCCLDSELANKIIQLIDRTIDGFDAIILSDYGKGIFQTEEFAQTVIRKANKRKIPTMVDPKGKDWQRYDGATCITPNVSELELVYGTAIHGKDLLINAMRDVKNKYNLTWLLTTRGSLGMCLMDQGDKPLFIPTVARDVYDVSGAGDTVISTLALGVSAGFTFPEATKLANIAAGVVVGKVGTQPVNIFELKSAAGEDGKGLNANFSSKITSFGAAKIQLQAWQANKEKIVFTNGCFDLLHPGHIHLLNQAKVLGDRLVVGLNADASIKRLKGSGRPILNENDRASLLGALDCVDLVVLFEQDTPEELIQTLKPDILAKGADYTLETVVGRKIVEAYGGQVSLLPLLDGYSTTDLTKKIIQVCPL